MSEPTKCICYPICQRQGGIMDLCRDHHIQWLLSEEYTKFGAGLTSTLSSRRASVTAFAARIRGALQ